mgnify:CR=1 FL=1
MVENLIKTYLKKEQLIGEGSVVHFFCCQVYDKNIFQLSKSLNFIYTGSWSE